MNSMSFFMKISFPNITINKQMVWKKLSTVFMWCGIRRLNYENFDFFLQSGIRRLRFLGVQKWFLGYRNGLGLRKWFLDDYKSNLLMPLWKKKSKFWYFNLLMSYFNNHSRWCFLRFLAHLILWYVLNFMIRNYFLIIFQIFMLVY